MLYQLSKKYIVNNKKSYIFYLISLSIIYGIFYMYKLFEQTSLKLNLGCFLHAFLNYYITMFSNMEFYLIVIIMIVPMLYSNWIFIMKNKRRYNIYTTLGMPQYQLYLLFILETFIINCIALIVGIFMFSIFSQYFLRYILSVISIDITNIMWLFSFDAVVQTVKLLIVVFLVIAILNAFLLPPNQQLNTWQKHNSYHIIAVNLFLFANGYVNTRCAYRLFRAFLSSDHNIRFVHIGYITLYLAIFITYVVLFIFSYKCTLKKFYCDFYNNFSSAMLSITAIITLFITIFFFNNSSRYVATHIKDNDDIDFFAYSMERDSDIVDSLSAKIDIDNTFSNYQCCNVWCQSDVEIEIPEIKSYYMNNSVKFMNISEYNKINKLKGKNNIYLNNQYLVLINSVCEHCLLQEYTNQKYVKINNKILFPAPNNIFVEQLGFIRDESLKPFDMAYIIVVPDEVIDLSESRNRIQIFSGIYKNKNLGIWLDDVLLKEKNKEYGSNVLVPSKKVYVITRNMRKMFLIKSFVHIGCGIYWGGIYFLSSLIIIISSYFFMLITEKHRYQILYTMGLSFSQIKSILLKKTLLFMGIPYIIACIGGLASYWAQAENDVSLCVSTSTSNTYKPLILLTLLYTCCMIFSFYMASYQVKRDLNIKLNKERYKDE